MDVAAAPKKRGRESLVPLGLSTTALIATDRRTADALHDDRTRLNVSHAISDVGSGYGLGASRELSIS